MYFYLYFFPSKFLTLSSNNWSVYNYHKEKIICNFNISVSDAKIHTELKRAQEALLGLGDGTSNPKPQHAMGLEYLQAAVPISKSHITLFLFNTDGDENNEGREVKDQRLSLAIETVKEAITEYKVWVSNSNKSIKPLSIALHGAGHFNNTVIFAKPKFVEYENFEMLWTLLQKHLVDKSFIRENDEKQHASSFADFSPHVTLMKMSRIYKQSRNRTRKDGNRGNLPRKFPNNSIDDIEHMQFGTQDIDRIELLSMTKEGKKGEHSYYFCKEEFSIAEHVLVKNCDIHSDHTNCCSPLMTPTVNEDSTESDTTEHEKVLAANKNRRRIGIEKENARKSVRASIISTLQSKLGFHTHSSVRHIGQRGSGESSHGYDEYNSSNTKNAILFIGGSLLTIAAIKTIINRLSK